MKPKKLTKAEREHLDRLNRRLEQPRAKIKHSLDCTPTKSTGTGNRTGNDFRGEGGMRGAASLVNGFHPKEVNRARRLMPKYAECIKDDGTVRFRNRQEERGFVIAQQVMLAKANAERDHHR